MFSWCAFRFASHHQDFMSRVHSSIYSPAAFISCISCLTVTMPMHLQHPKSNLSWSWNCSTQPKKNLCHTLCVDFTPPTPVPVSTSQRVLWNPQAYTCHFSSLIFSLASREGNIPQSSPVITLSAIHITQVMNNPSYHPNI